MAEKDDWGRASAPKDKADIVRQTIVETLEAPRLAYINTDAFVDFQRKREEYERLFS